LPVDEDRRHRLPFRGYPEMRMMDFS